MRSVQLDEGAVLLGAVSAVILLLADGTALIGRSLGDAQKLFDAFGRFCDKYHAEISTPKTKALCFRSDSSSMKLAESSMYRRVRYESRSAATHFFERLGLHLVRSSSASCDCALLLAALAPTERQEDSSNRKGGHMGGQGRV